jgi:hypothetical protein
VERGKGRTKKTQNEDEAGRSRRTSEQDNVAGGEEQFRDSEFILKS